MNKKIIMSALICFLLSGCTFKQELGREIKPAEKYNIRTNEDGQAEYRDNIAGLTMETVSDSQWEKLLGFNCFKNKKSSSSTWRTPKLIFHHLTLKNTGSSPVRIAGIKLGYGQKEKPALSPEEIKKICKSPAYSLIDFSSLLKNRRLLCGETLMDEINFDKESIEYKFDFVNGGDTVSRIIAFEWIPVEHRTYKITLWLEYPAEMKIINLEFIRLEYRDRGPFSKPEKEELDDEMW